MLQNICISNKSFISIHSVKMYHGFHTNIKQCHCFQLTVDNKNKCYLAPNHPIRMISEGSYDTEDWSNDL